MRSLSLRSAGVLLFSLFSFTLCSCATDYKRSDGTYSSNSFFQSDYASRLPSNVNTNGQRMVLVDPTVHAWGAYDNKGSLVKAGIATAGGNWCPDIGRPCRTNTGTFRINSLGDGQCISHIYPRPHGGGLMPYCMYFSGGEALHGSPDNTLVEDNISHGCVRLRIADAEWLRYNFVSVGTKVVVKPY
jgi:lipoprotein-anchoring transpeptidase ErfK/SrfK